LSRKSELAKNSWGEVARFGGELSPPKGAWIKPWCNIMAFMIINPVLYNNDNSNNNKTSTCSSAIILTRMQKAMQSSNKVKYNYKMLFEKIGKI